MFQLSWLQPHRSSRAVRSAMLKIASSIRLSRMASRSAAGDTSATIFCTHDGASAGSDAKYGFRRTPRPSMDSCSLKMAFSHRPSIAGMGGRGHTSPVCGEHCTTCAAGVPSCVMSVLSCCRSRDVRCSGISATHDRQSVAGYS